MCFRLVLQNHSFFSVYIRKFGVYLFLLVLALKSLLSNNILIGDHKSFSLEERMFNTVCVIAFVSMCFEVPFNFAIGLIVPGSLCLFGVIFSAFLYYLSRIRRKSSFGIKLFCVVCNIAFAVNYFYNSGMKGPNLLLFSIVLLMIVAVIPKKDFKIWIPVNLILVFSILVVEYFYPNSAPNVYQSELSKVVDFATTYFVIVLLTYFAISYIRKNYDIERQSVMEKNIAIELQKQVLERLNSEKDKLFSIVTHDIRMPLNSIQSYLELLSQSDLSEEERFALKQQLLQITKDTSDMLTNVLTWSKTQMEGANVVLEVLEVKNALEIGLLIEKNVSVRKGVELTIDCENELLISADQNMFQLVVRNLVNNAIKFTPSGGLVEISTYRVGDECHIKIKDSGLGIDPSRQKLLFKLKASSTYGTNNEKGIGLGLLLTKEFTQLQGGKVWFESNVDQGSTFFLSFKLAKLADS